MCFIFVFYCKFIYNALRTNWYESTPSSSPSVHQLACESLSLSLFLFLYFFFPSLYFSLPVFLSLPPSFFFSLVRLCSRLLRRSPHSLPLHLKIKLGLCSRAQGKMAVFGTTSLSYRLRQNHINFRQISLYDTYIVVTRHCSRIITAVIT